MKKYQIHTSKSPERVFCILSDNVGERRYILSPLGAAFYGKLYLDSFRLLPNYETNNAFRPVILGRITATESGTVIDIISSMYIYTIVFLLLWMSGAFYAVISGVRILIDGNGPQGLIIGLLFVFIGWLVTTGFYWAEETGARSKLHSLLADN